MKPSAWAGLILGVALLSGAASGQQERSWPMAGADPQRSSWSPEEVGGPVKPVWYRPIEPYISQNVQIVAADGKLFVSTARGLYALDAETGETAWVYPTEMPLGHSPTFHDGVLYVGGFDRKLHAIDARTGKRRWAYAGATAGYRTNPVVAEGLVLLGNRDGSFYAVRAREGTLAWKYRTEAPINYSAAYKDGAVYFASMDGRAYALSAADGRERWKTAPLHGAGFHSWWPVVYRDKVLLVTAPNYRNGQKPGATSCPDAGNGGGYYHDVEHRVLFGKEGPREEPIGPSGTEPGDWAPGTFTMNAIRAAKFFGEHPWRRTLICLDSRTGADWGLDMDGDGKLEYAPVTWTGTKNGIRPPPMISGFDKVVYQHNHYGGAGRSHVSGWKLGTPFISRISRDYGATDEPHIVSGGGRFLYWSILCDREAGIVDLSKPFPGTQEWSVFPGYRLHQVVPGYDEMWFGVGDQDGTGNRLWGYYGSLNGIYHNHTNDQNPFIPYRGKLYIHRSNCVIAFGKEGGAARKPRAAAARAPEDTRVTLSEAQLRELLAEEIRKWLDAGHLHIGYFNGSQFGHVPKRYSHLNDYFESPGENLWALLRALPHVPAPLQKELREFIRKEFAAYPPAATASIGWKDGASRDYFLYPPEVDADRANFPASPRSSAHPWRTALPPINFYALWKYAKEFGGAAEHYAAAKGKLPAPPPEADWPRYPYEVNASIAGHVGYLELEKLAGQPESAPVRAALEKMLAWRAENFSKDTPSPSTGPYNKAQPNSHLNRLNVSRNFIYLTPELARHLREKSPGKVREAVEEYNRVGPYWFVSRYEGCLQEATVQNFHDTFALFAAKAWILAQPREELVKYLDVPAFRRGDCFYLHNLVSALEAPSSPPAAGATPGEASGAARER